MNAHDEIQNRLEDLFLCIADRLDKPEAVAELRSGKLLRAIDKPELEQNLCGTFILDLKFVPLSGPVLPKTSLRPVTWIGEQTEADEPLSVLAR